MKQALIAAVAIATLLSPAAIAKPAGPHDHAPADNMARMFKTLGLTADQQAKVKAIRERHRAAVKADWAALKAKQQELSTLLRSPAATVDAALAKQKEIDALRARLNEGRVRAWFETRAVLTPEQLQKLPSLKFEHHRERDEW
jgi:Spy/CpxP family protein refolding chaperone